MLGTSQIQSSQIDSVSHYSQRQNEIQQQEELEKLRPIKVKNQSTLTPTQIDVMFQLPSSEQRQIVRRVETYQNINGDIILRPIIYYFKEQGFNVQGNLVAYWSNFLEAYIYCGNDPLPQSAHIPYDQYENNDGRIYLKFKPGLRSEQSKIQDDPSSAMSSSKRTKQRKIGYIIERVSLWRKLYNGLPDGKGNIIRYSLQDSAQKVGISKKSLDDYLLQLRFGRKFGFNFNEHKDSKVGTLRAYVKKHKMEAQKKKK